MGPLTELTYHNYPSSLPEFVPATPEDAAAKLYSVCRYLYKRQADSIRDAIANIQSRDLLIKLHDKILAENWQFFGGNLIDSLTETVERREGAKPCRTREQ